MRSFFVVVLLLTTLVSQSTAQPAFAPVFHLSQYDTFEGGQQVVGLSLSILSRPQVPSFTGSIEIDVTAEDLPTSDTRQTAEFGIDYLANPQNPSSRTFTVLFQSKQANSSEHVIQIADDVILEGSESFRLRIVAARFSGQAAVLFRAQDGLNNTFADVNIADNDVVLVNWTISQPINVTEGDNVTVRLSGEAFGIYANPIAIGVICAEVISTDVEPAFPDLDFSYTPGAKLHFTDVNTERSFSSDQVVILIINDDIAEPCKSFICTLQEGGVQSVQGIEPNRVTIEICDDDVLTVRYEQDRYTVSEETGYVTLALVLEGDAPIPVTVSVNTLNLLNSSVGDAATAVVDYISRSPFEITFPPGSRRQLYNVTIVDDTIPENSEFFNADVNLARPEDASTIIIGSPKQPLIEILDIDGAPSITVTAPAYIIQGDTLTVNCSMMSFPQSNMSLSLDDFPIVTSVSEAYDTVLGLFSYFTSYSTTAMHPSDEGNYTCSATITHNQPAVTEVYSEAVFVAVYAHPFIWDHPVDQTVNQSNQATISCTAQGNPVPAISWTGPSDNFTTEDTFGTNFTMLSVLTIDSAVRALHEGLYTCSASNGVGPPSRSSATLTVQVPPTVQPVLGRVVGLELMHVTLAFVILDASPAVQAQSIHWSFSSVHTTSVSIPSNSLTTSFSNLTGVFSDDRLILILSGLNNDFEGTYTMTATNEAGSTSASIHLLIESRPRIIKPPEDLQVVDGVIVTFDCFALAEPLHSLTWYFTSANGSNVTIASINGTEKMITHGGKYQITDNSTSPDEYGRLLVRDVQFENRGTYTCLAENRHGLDSDSATLAVQVPPMILSTSRQVDIAINSNDAITLKCSLQGYPLSALHWEKGGTPLAPDGPHISITNFRKLDPMDTYPFSSTLDSSFQPIPLEGLEYFEAVSELTLVPPITRTDTANYTCVVEADFVQSYTETSDNIPVNVSESTVIQLHLRPVSDCLTWVGSKGDAKLSEVSAALSARLQQQCSCSLSVQQSLFSCLGTTDSQTVVFLAELSYTALPGVDMPSLLASWVASTPHIAVASTQLQVDTICPVVVESLQPESCPVASTVLPTDPPTDSFTEPPTNLPTDVTVIAVAVCVSVLVVATVIVAIVIAVIVCCRTWSKYRLKRPLPNPVYEYEYISKVSGGVALANMTRNPSYVTEKEAKSTSFVSDTEEAKEVDHMYKELPFEASVEGQEDTIHGGQKDVADGQESAVDDVHVYTNK